MKSFVEGIYYEFLTCGQCGIRWGMPQHFVDERRAGAKQSKTFYCPNGHSRAFVETENDKLRRECDRLKQDAARLEEERDMARRAEAKAEAEVNRVTRRAVAAVCPCCNRHFVQLDRHMRRKHPELVKVGPALANRRIARDADKPKGTDS